MAEKEIARDRVRKGAERRRHERHSLSEVPGRLHLARDVTVFDLSTTGMGIETSE